MRPSRLIADAELRLAVLAKELEASVGPRLADERNRSIGFAGHVNYVVDRGPFRVAVEGESLLVRTDVKVRAEACRGNDCYASCAPEGHATARVALRLTPEYRFAPSHVSFAFTRPCEVKALGGMLKMDVTPTIQAQLGPALHQVEREIDAKLPPVRAHAERLWAELDKTRMLPLGRCAVVNPRGIVQGPIAGTAEVLRVRFGVIAHPELRHRCVDPPSTEPHPLPPLAQDALPASDDLELALVAPKDVVVSGLESVPPFDAGGGRARIARARVLPSSAPGGAPSDAIDLTLAGEVCGDVALQSPLGWTEDGRALRLSAPRLLSSAAPLAPDTLVRSLATARIPPPADPQAIKDIVPSLASSMSDPTLEVSAHIERVTPTDVAVRGDDISARVVVRGRIALRQR